MVSHPDGIQLQGNNQRIPQPAVGLPMLPLVSPLIPFGRHPMRLVRFAVTTNTTIAKIRTVLVSPEVLPQHYPQKRSTYVSMAIT